MFAAKLVLLQSTGFKFNHQPLDFLSASPLLWNGFVDLISLHGALVFYPVKVS
jgi:hypothetical protein